MSMPMPHHPDRTLIFLLGLLFSQLTFAESITVTQNAFQMMQGVSRADGHVIQSKVTGRPYHVLVQTPRNANSDTDYPTVYLLDGGLTFPMLASYYQYLRFEETVPDAIIVGLSYAADTFDEGNYRSTDYTAPSEERQYWGGAADFQKVLRTEIIPFVEDRYASDPQQRILFGQSLGGQFVLFSALTEPGLFQGHIASNPALHRNLDFFIKTRPQKPTGTTRLFIAMAEDDEPQYRVPARQWLDAWQKQPAFPSSVSILPGHGHFSAVTEAFRRGLIYHTTIAVEESGTAAAH